VSDVLKLIKANSSKWINDEKVLGRDFAWQVGYAAFSVSESQAETVRRYIRNQQEHHRRQPFREELIALLQRHSVQYDPRYMWD